MYLFFRTKIQSVGILDRTSWSTGAHTRFISSHNYQIMCLVYLYKQDAVVGLIGLQQGCLHTFFFRERKRPTQVVEKS